MRYHQESRSRGDENTVEINDSMKSRQDKSNKLQKMKEEIERKKEELQRSDETRRMLVTGMQQKQMTSESELKELKEAISGYDREELVQVTRLEAEVEIIRKQIQEKQKQNESEYDYESLS